MAKRKKKTGQASAKYRKSVEGIYQKEEGRYTRSYAPVSLPYPRREELSPVARNIRTIAGYGALGIGAATGLFYLVRHFVNQSKAKGSEKRSTEAGNPATYAKLLRMAFDNDNMVGWGTDEDLVFQVIREIPSQSMYDKVQSEYSAQNSGKSLNADLSSELSSSDYQQVVQLLKAKPAK